VAELSAFSDPNADRLAGLVFELAAQVHVERQLRMALEATLVRNGVVSRIELDELAGDDAFLDDVRAALRNSQQRLLDVMLEQDDARRPLRDRPAAAGRKDA
jgi:hypothetical protein